MIVSTGNGRHIYYRHPGGTVKNSAGQLGVGLDVRADGGYVVAAPSRHVLQIVASACRYPVEKTAEKSLKRQNENPLYWFRFDVRHWFSDQNLNAMRDDQTGWHIRLIVFAWNKGGFLTSDPAQLWRLAGAKSCSHFIKHCSLGLADFDMVTECDGIVVLRHRFMAAEYAATLQKWMQKVSSGKKGGGSGALGVLSKVDGCADVVPWPEQNSFDIQACADESPAKFLTAEEAAAYLGGLNSRTLTRWAREAICSHSHWRGQAEALALPANRS
jgi:hypothetical protein